MWQDLKIIAYEMHYPWLLAEDFNDIPCSDKKKEVQLKEKMLANY